MKDNSIILLYHGRDETALDASREKYGRYCHKIAINVLGSHEDAEECVSDTFLAAWGLMPPEKPNSLRAFFGKITRNIALTRYHKNVSKKRGGGEVALVLDELAECVASDTSVEDEVMAGELKRQIHIFLKTLSERDRHMFIERYFYTDSVKEIAARHETKEDYVRVVLSRVRNKLKTYLEENNLL